MCAFSTFLLFFVHVLLLLLLGKRSYLGVVREDGSEQWAEAEKPAPGADHGHTSAAVAPAQNPKEPDMQEGVPT